MTSFRVTGPGVAARPGAVVLPEVLVPMLWWRGVPMRRAQPVSMTALERFVLELAMTTGRADADEFFEITGLPHGLLPVGARRLVAARALQHSDGGFTPRFPGATRAARTRTVYEQRHASLDIVLLPRTGDLVALDPRSSGLRELDRLRPRSAGNAPLPAALAGVALADYLRDRLRAGSVAGVAEDVTDVAGLPQESPRLPGDGWCPAYRFRGELRPDGDGYLASITYGGDGRQTATVTLPGADGLAGRWLELANLLDDPAARARAWAAVARRHEDTVPAADRTAPGRWTWHLPAASAQRLADLGHNLALPLGLTAEQETAVAELTLDLAAADDAARRLVETDRLLTAAADPGADTAAVPRTREAWQRAWRLGFPRLVYTLREREDFGHG